MARTIITPDSTDIKLSIPSDYIGRKIEVLNYPVDELIEEKPIIPKSMASFRGILSREEGNALQKYVKKSKEY